MNVNEWEKDGEERKSRCERECVRIIIIKNEERRNLGGSGEWCQCSRVYGVDVKIKAIPHSVSSLILSVITHHSSMKKNHSSFLLYGTNIQNFL